jgi:sporulation protein YtfJ
MSNHPIEALMKTAMESIKEMVDVNTVVGDAVQAPDGTVIIPVSRVAVGFAAGGGEYQTIGASNGGKEAVPVLPFGGGSGAGVSVQPVGFLVVGNNNIRLLPVEGNFVVDRLIDIAPQIASQFQGLFKSKEAKDNMQVESKTGDFPLQGGA